MNAQRLFEHIRQKRSFLCVGLDTDLAKIPRALLVTEYPMFEFNRRIIDATADLAVAYKPNLAFYESQGAAGWISLEMTVGYIKEKYPEILVIADAKRGDIGNTSKMYAKAFFNNLGADAVTVAPYMGEDSVTPFLTYPDKWVVLLALTSNKGSDDFQLLSSTTSNLKLYEEVLKKSQAWGTTNNLMYVVGATKADMLVNIRRIVPEHFLLVPGVGAQGGSLTEVARNGMNNQCGLLVNSSRDILYADVTEQFDKTARSKALALQQEMDVLLKEKGI
jgi:orotidine-5'-phosphate decarboxylase